MNRLGMMVDVSHVADSTFWQVLETTNVPIIASHSSARTLTDTPRNLSDEQLRAVAANNGVVMVNFYPPFIDEAWRKAWLTKNPTRDAYREADCRSIPPTRRAGDSLLRFDGSRPRVLRRAHECNAARWRHSVH